MTTRIALANLVGMHEIAERAGVQRGTVLQWRQRYPDFPPPLLHLNLGPVWNWRDVQPWVRRHQAGTHVSII